MSEDEDGSNVEPEGFTKFESLEEPGSEISDALDEASPYSKSKDSDQTYEANPSKDTEQSTASSTSQLNGNEEKNTEIPLSDINIADIIPLTVPESLQSSLSSDTKVAEDYCPVNFPTGRKFKGRTFNGNQKGFDVESDNFRVNLNAKGLQEFPVDIVKVKYVKYLHLDKNQIKTFQGVDPGDLLGLEILSLQENGLSSIPLEIQLFHNLKILNVSYNEISHIPKELLQLGNMRQLLLNSNHIDTY